MRRSKAPPERREPDRTAPSGAGPRLARLLIPPAVALVLAAPLVGCGYLLDDFEFFARVERPDFRHFLPDPASLFYRPFSRELYFTAVRAMGTAHPLWGHAANLILLLAAVSLLAWFVARLSGERAGYYAGVLFAGLGALPVLVGWTSGDQDLLAMIFVLLALAGQLRGSRAGALAAAAIALLCKETAVAFVPAIVLLPLLAGRGKARLRGDATAFAILVAAWAAIHPGVAHLLAHHLESSGRSGGYVSLSSATAWRSLAGSAATLLNLPLPGAVVRWPAPLAPYFVGAALLAVLGGRLAGGSRRAAAGTSPPRAMLPLALALCVPPLLLSAVLLRYWMPYYVGISSLGVSLAAGAWLTRMGRWPSVCVLVGWLALGVLVRGQSLGPEVLTEPSLLAAGKELDRVEDGFRRLLPGLAQPKAVTCMIQAPPGGSSYIHLFRFQVLRSWFENPRIDAIHPEWRRPHPPEEHLLAVGEDQTVYEVDLRTFEVRATVPDPPPFPEGSLLRSYAQGLALSGEIERARAILLALPEADSHVANMNRRLAAAYLLALGRGDEAKGLLAGLPPFAPEDAAEVAAASLANPARIDLDRPVITAMGLDPGDPATLRFMMRWLMRNGSEPSGARIARKLLAAVPGDPEARAVVEAEERVRTEHVLAPAVADSLW